MTEHDRMRQVLGFGLVEGDHYDIEEQAARVTTKDRLDLLLADIVLCVEEPWNKKSND